MIGDEYVTSIRGYVAWTTISDGRVKKNIKQDVPGLAFIKLLEPVTYNLDLDAANKITKTGAYRENATDSLLRKAGADSLQLRRVAPEISSVEAKAREAQQKRLYTGFVAQDVEKAAKSIGYDFSGVDASESGNNLYGLRYEEFIVPLVKAVQELSAENDAKDSIIVSMKHQIDQLQTGETADETTVASLKHQVDELTILVNQLVEKGNVSKNISVPLSSLEQNFPNPFNNTTTISYSLPQTFRSAKIVISDTAGRIVKQILITTGTGPGNVSLQARQLKAGAYYYSLYVDNKTVDTKKMVVIN